MLEDLCVNLEKEKDEDDLFRVKYGSKWIRSKSEVANH